MKWEEAREAYPQIKEFEQFTQTGSFFDLNDLKTLFESYSVLHEAELKHHNGVKGLFLVIHMEKPGMQEAENFLKAWHGLYPEVKDVYFWPVRSSRDSLEVFYFVDDTCK